MGYRIWFDLVGREDAKQVTRCILSQLDKLLKLSTDTNPDPGVALSTFFSIISDCTPDDRSESVKVLKKLANFVKLYSRLEAGYQGYNVFWGIGDSNQDILSLPLYYAYIGENTEDGNYDGQWFGKIKDFGYPTTNALQVFPGQKLVIKDEIIETHQWTGNQGRVIGKEQANPVPNFHVKFYIDTEEGGDLQLNDEDTPEKGKLVKSDEEGKYQIIWNLSDEDEQVLVSHALNSSEEPSLKFVYNVKPEPIELRKVTPEEEVINAGLEEEVELVVAIFDDEGNRIQKFFEGIEWKIIEGEVQLSEGTFQPDGLGSASKIVSSATEGTVIIGAFIPGTELVVPFSISFTKSLGLKFEYISGDGQLTPLRGEHTYQGSFRVVNQNDTPMEGVRVLVQYHSATNYNPNYHRVGTFDSDENGLVTWEWDFDVKGAYIVGITNYFDGVYREVDFEANPRFGIHQFNISATASKGYSVCEAGFAIGPASASVRTSLGSVESSVDGNGERKAYGNYDDCGSQIESSSEPLSTDHNFRIPYELTATSGGSYSGGTAEIRIGIISVNAYANAGSSDSKSGVIEIPLLNP